MPVLARASLAWSRARRRCCAAAVWRRARSAAAAAVADGSVPWAAVLGIRLCCCCRRGECPVSPCPRPPPLPVSLPAFFSHSLSGVAQPWSLWIRVRARTGARLSPHSFLSSLKISSLVRALFCVCLLSLSVVGACPFCPFCPFATTADAFRSAGTACVDADRQSKQRAPPPPPWCGGANPISFPRFSLFLCLLRALRGEHPDRPERQAPRLCATFFSVLAGIFLAPLFLRTSFFLSSKSPSRPSPPARRPRRNALPSACRPRRCRHKKKTKNKQFRIFALPAWQTFLFAFFFFPKPRWPRPRWFFSCRPFAFFLPMRTRHLGAGRHRFGA